MIFSKPKQVSHRKFGYEPRYAKDNIKERTISFREEGAFLSRKEQVAGNLRDVRYAKRIPDRKTNKVTKFLLIIGLMSVIYGIYSDSIGFSDYMGGDLAKVLVGFGLLFLFLFMFIKKSNSSI
ncbi:hypothetical protein GC194_15265 [bacterium]|nr:hypothetical protein [bacterium]